MDVLAVSVFAIVALVCATLIALRVLEGGRE